MSGFLTSQALWFLLGIVLAILGCLQVSMLLHSHTPSSGTSSSAWMQTMLKDGENDDGRTVAQNKRIADELQALTNEMKAVRLKMEERSKASASYQDKNGASGDSPEVENENDISVPPNNSTIGSCQDILQRMLDWNDCWRRFIFMQQLDPTMNQEDAFFLGRKITCPHLHTQKAGPNQPITTTRIGAPVYHSAYLEGQGFGRMIEHTAETCVTAFLLQRPCLVDIEPRDPYFTWRSFVQEGPYRWDPAVLRRAVNNNSYTKQIYQLVEKLPTKGSNDWEGTIQVSDYQGRLVFPMETKYPKAEWKKTLFYYSGTRNDERGQQILLAPNWGNAWFTRIPVNVILKEQYNCRVSEMWTLVENAMYQPTDLTRQLHKTRLARARTAWNEKNEASATIPTTIYGSVHIRLYFINGNRDARGEPHIDERELAATLHKCLYRVSVLYQQRNSPPSSHPKATETFPQKWWFLGDNATMAALVAQELQNLQRDHREPGGKQLPRLQIFHDYNMTSINTATAIKNKHKSSVESKSVHAQGMYGHSFMAGSIEDWMTLHQSEVSIVMSEGSFGRTGARGNGKVGGEICSDNFQIFMKPNRNDDA